MKEDEYLLYKNTLKNAPKEESSELGEQYKQKSNRRFLGYMLYVKIYNAGELAYDTAAIREEIVLTNKYYDEKIDTSRLRKKFSDTPKGKEKRERYVTRMTEKRERKLASRYKTLKEGNLVMRGLGEKPVIYDSTLTEKTKRNFENHLFKSGYLKNNVTHKNDTAHRKKRINITYIIDPGPQYSLDTLHYKIQDTLVYNLVLENEDDSKVKLGEPYNDTKINEERERIYMLMKNNGYFDFERQNITFKADTLWSKGDTAKGETWAGRDSIKQQHRVKLVMRIEGQHKVYHLSRMYFNMDVSPQVKQDRDTTFYKNIFYTYTKKTYLRKLLDYKIATRPTDVYSYYKIQTTQRMLGSLDLYKFVNINFEKDRADSSGLGLSCFVNTSPMARFQLSQEYGVSVGQAYVPGPFFMISLKTRNIFRSLEVWETTARYSLDAQASVTDPNNDKAYRTQEISIQTSVTLPQLLLQTRLRDIFTEYNPRLKFQLGYTYIRRPEYRRENFRAGFSYTFQKNIYKHWIFTPVEINVIGSEVNSDFNAFLTDLKTKGSNLYLSFRPSIVTGASLSYVFNNHDATTNKRSAYFRPTLEIGGIIPNVLSQEFSPAIQSDSNKLLNKQYFEFYRISSDLRFYFPAGKKNTIAVRFNAGYAQPFASSGRKGFFALPYEKYFFSGGNSSIRAWRPRRLGPGSYYDSSGYIYEQPGEILFETNYEYRFNIISFLDGALFVDAGNVWTLRDSTRSGSTFKYLRSFEEIAVGAGFGIRLDFSFLIIRFDLANKIVDPAMRGTDKISREFDIRESLLNIGIGYPF